MIFFQVYPLCTPFTLLVLFCKKYLNYTYFHSFTPVKAFKSTLTLFKGHFVKIMNFCQNSSNLSDFASQNFEGMYLFFFLPFFCTIYGEWSTSMILFSPIKILAKKGKKRVLYTFWSKSTQNFKISIFSKNCPISYSCYFLYTNFSYFVLKKSYQNVR